MKSEEHKGGEVAELLKYGGFFDEYDNEHYCSRDKSDEDT